MGSEPDSSQLPPAVPPTAPPKPPAEVPLLSDVIRQRIALEEQIKELSKPIVKSKRFWWWLWGGAGVATLGTVIVLLFNRMLTDHSLLIFAPFGFAVYIALTIKVGKLLQVFFRSRLERKLATLSTTQKSEELQEKLEENFFTNLVKINFKYIDKYYLQTQLQADKSFLLCAIAACVSLAVILGGIVMLFVNENARAAGYVATAAGTLGEFIATVFFYLYNQTITKMGEYHQKLVLTQNVSLALKISEELPTTQQVTARGKLIEYLSKDINLFLTAKAAEPVKPARHRAGPRGRPQQRR